MALSRVIGIGKRFVFGSLFGLNFEAAQKASEIDNRPFERRVIRR
jgi:hypothetical protein